MADHLKRREDFTDVEPRVFHVDHSLGDEEPAAVGNRMTVYPLGGHLGNPN